MSTPPATDGGPVVELDEEIDGDEIGSRNYRFSKIGESVPINSEFDPKSLPAQPLAVSERLRLLFVAHPQGFYVSRTKDVMEAAEEIKEKQSGPSLKDLSLVDVPIGNVSILALSADDSLLAASVDSHAHFFAVSALLHKDQTPSYSVSLDDSSCIKDVRWAKKAARAYLILSDNGKLYNGSGQGPLACVMESVDSVDWSVKGNFVAVAKKNTVIILSSELKEKLRFLLSFQSVVGDSDVNQVIKVDSIRWIRPDCIAVGCFQLNDDGEEENYIVQVITSRGGWVTDESSKPTVLSFSNVFMDFCSDAVPTRNGPHLFLSYLDLYGVAFIANRNLSQKVGLFRWSSDSGKNEVAMVEILNDAWTLYIDTQDNDEENVILGLSVDKVSQNENVKFTLGDVESEVSPCCVIICLTIDGKISVFHFSSAAGALEDDASRVLAKHELPLISSTGGEESKDPTFSTPESHKFSRSEVEKTGAKATITNDVSPSINVDVEPQEQTTTENMGQKPLVYSRAAKVDEPEKALPLVLNQDINVKNQSLSGVKHSTGFFSGKVVGDFSRQPITKDPSSGFNVEPLRKAPPTSSPSFWSTAGVNASTTSDGKFSLLPSDVGNSDKHALESAGHVLRQPTNINEKAKPAVASTSFGLRASTVQGPKPGVSSTSSGLTASTAQGHRNSLSAYPSSQVSLGASVASGKPFQSEFRKELNSSSSATDAPKQFGTVEEMAKKLDILLEDIEGKGGFIDASITSQTKSVMELEDGIWTLSGRCRKWKGLMNEQLRELQLLLDKTVQALVRKVYIEGVFKQATDTRYWELWNRQKLSSELELKQRRILELNQELTNKLIELERHFNTLEFNKFGENGGMQRNRRVLQHSRQTQSLHSLHNTMQAQLAAAEQLSGCLSNQMSALRIESCEKQDVKKKLFESIGLSYFGDTERSPAGNRTSGTPLNKEHLISSNSIASKEHSRRNQASFAKSPETARRRRDSLDRSWTSFEPPKTTVKRVLKEDYEQGSANRSLLNIDKQYPSPRSQKKSEFAHSARSNMFRASLNSYKSRGTGETPEQHTESPLTSLHQRTADSLDNGNQVSSTKSSFALPPPSIFETKPIQNIEQTAFKLIDEKPKSNLSLTRKDFVAGESSFVHKQPDTSFNPLPSISTQSPEQSLISSSVSTESSDHFKLGFTKSTTVDQKKNTSVGSETPSFDFKIPINPASAFSSVTNVSEKGSFTMSSEKPTRLNDNSAASSIPLQSLFGSSSLFSSNNVPSSFASSASKPSSSTSFSTPSFAPSSPSYETNVSSISPSSGLIKPEESPASLSHPPVDNTPTKTLVDNMPPETEKDVKIQASPSQPAFAISTLDLKLGPSTSSVPTELSTDLKLGSQIDFGGLSKSSSSVASVPTELSTDLSLGSQIDFGGLSKSSSSVASVSKTDLSPVAPSSEGIIGSLKNVVSNSSHEEEMDEEAPETDQTSGLSLGNLGGFGIGSTPNSTTPKPNPFGVTNLNNNTAFASLPNMISTPSSGELFRPASFNFQSPQSPQPVQPTAVNFPGGFSSGNSGQAVSGFGQPAHIGAGQQALGSVLGSFGQSRQIGTGLPGNNVAPASGFGGGFKGVSPGGFGGGFASAAPSAGGFASLAAGGGGFGTSGVAGGGFAAAANAVGGFAAAATGGGGFGALATGGGGFAAAATGGGGFAAAATGGGGFGAATPTIGGAGSNPGGGFGAFGNQQGGGGGFSAFGGGSGVANPPSELFTQIRK